MTGTSYIVDLESSGRIFKNNLRIVGFTNREVPSGYGYKEEINWIYEEIASQLTMIIDGDQESTLKRLLTIPYMGNLGHVTQLQDPERFRFFAESCKIFGFSLISIINRRIHIKEGADYLLEAIADDYAVVAETFFPPKG